MSRGLLISAVVVALVAGAAFATPTVTYTTTLEATYSGVGNLTHALDNIPDATNASMLSSNPGTIFQFDISATISGLAAGENWDNLLSGVTLQPGLSFADINTSGALTLADGFLMQTPAGDPYKIGVTAIFTNSGVTTGTPQGIFVACTAITGEGKNPGVVPHPLDLGQVYVVWDGSTPATVTIAPLPAAGGGAQNTFSTWENNTTGSGTALAWVTGTYGETNSVQSFGAIPEPATMALLLVGGIGALLRRRK